MWAKLLGTVATFSLVTLLALAGQTEKGAGKASGKGIEGNWTATGANVGGKKVPDEVVQKVNLSASFKDGKFSSEVGGKQIAAGSYKITGADKIELTHTEGKQKGKTEKGMFKIEGNTLTTAFPAGETDAEPKSFEPGEKAEITTFKRDASAAGTDKKGDAEKKTTTKKAEKE